MLKSKSYQETLNSMAVDEVHCVTEWGSSSNNNRSAFRPFCVWYFRDSRNFNYAILTPGD